MWLLYLGSFRLVVTMHRSHTSWDEQVRFRVSFGWRRWGSGVAWKRTGVEAALGRPFRWEVGRSA